MESVGRTESVGRYIPTVAPPTPEPDVALARVSTRVGRWAKGVDSLLRPGSSLPTSPADGPGKSTSGVPLSDDGMPNNPVSGDRVSDDRVLDDPVSGDQVSNDPVSGDRVSDDRVPDDPVSGDQVSDDRVPNDPMSGDRVSDVFWRTHVGNSVPKSKIGRAHV